MTGRSFSDVILAAAVSGRFDPIALFEEIPDDELWEIAARLAAECDEDLSGGRHLWLLRAPARRAALRLLTDRNAVRQVLRNAPIPDEGDLFAIHLRRALVGKWGAANQSDGGEIDEARHAALQFVREVPSLSAHRDLLARSLENTRDRIARRERLDSLAMVLPPGRLLIGRDRERRKLKHFAQGRSPDPRPMVVSGIGGVGKSALLADIIRDWTDRRNAPAVLLLDFDRPALSGGDPFEIVREITRQLAFEGLGGRDQEEAQQTLHEIRGQLNVLREIPGEADPDHAGGIRIERLPPDEQFSMLLTLAFQPLAEGLPQVIREQPMLLVLDTFEVVAVLGDAASSRILDLEAALRDRAGLKGLRTIISGRSLEQALEPLADRLSPSRNWLLLEGLKPDDGAAFLKSKDQNRRFPLKRQRLRAAKALKGHPLALLVLELYARERTDAEVAAMLKDLAADRGLTAEFAQRFLYSRILDRISDPEIKAIAHPGLVLRQVSSHLIRLVLAEPCGLGAVDKDRSAQLLAKLKRQYWLVDTLGDDLVRHRPDLRRMMLAGMFSPPRAEDSPSEAARKSELAEKAIAVSLSAARFYATPPAEMDPAYAAWVQLGAEAREVEHVYHLALSGAAPPAMTKSEALAFQRRLGEDFEVLPDIWRAVTKASAGTFARLTDAERDTLTGPLRDAAEAARIDILIREGAATEARKRVKRERSRKDAEAASVPAGTSPDLASLSSEPKPEVPPHADSDPGLLEQAVRSNFADAYVAEAARAGEPLVRQFLQQHPYWREAPSVRFGYASFFGSALWLAALSVATKGPGMPPADELTDFGARTYDQLSAILLTHLILDPDLPTRLRTTESRIAEELMTRRGRTGMVEKTRAMASAARLAPAFWSQFESVELSAEGLCLFSRELIELAGKNTGLNFDGFEVLVSHQLQRAAVDVLASGAARLRDFDSLYETPGVIAVSRKASTLQAEPLLSLLRGLTPELHEPTSHLLMRLDDDKVIDLVRRVASTEAFWPTDLVFMGSADLSSDPNASVALRYSKRDAQTIVRTADRCGALRRLLYILREHDSTAEDLIQIHDLISERVFTVPSGNDKPEL